MTNEEYMSLALDLAREAAEHGEVPVGCVIADAAGRVIGRGRNRREEKQAVFSHAEMEAIASANEALGTWRLDDCTLYVTLEPCPMCAGLLAQAGLDEIVFGARDALAGCCGSVYDLTEDPALPYGRTPSAGGLLEAECRQLLQDFFKARRKSDA